MIDRAPWRNILSALDFPLISAVVLTYFIGVASIYSAGGGSEGLGRFYAGRQLLWGVVALGFFVLTLRLDLHFFIEKAYWIYGACCVLLLLLFVLGHRARGAQSWLNFGIFSVQPAEFAKLGLALALARRLAEKPPADLRSFVSTLALGGVSALLVLVQPDLGSTLVYCVMIGVALIVAGAPKRYILSLFGLCVAALPFAWLLLKDYQKKRLLVFLNPQLDPFGSGYNVIQSRIAVGSGRLFGAGFMHGAQSKLRFLPESHTDFIFSVFAEEFGLVGSLILLSLLGFILWRILRVAVRSRRLTTKILIVALSAYIWFHCVESIAMSMGLLPVTGLPLPLVSYGGSSLLTVVLAVSMVLKIGAEDELWRRENTVPEGGVFSSRPLARDEGAADN